MNERIELIVLFFPIARSTSCSDAYTIEIEQQFDQLGEKSGKYVKFCLANLDNEPIYKHESDNFYMTHLAINADLNFWIISERINGDLVAEFLGVNTAATNCPDSMYTPSWFLVENLGETIINMGLGVNITVTMTID